MAKTRKFVGLSTGVAKPGIKPDRVSKVKVEVPIGTSGLKRKHTSNYVSPVFIASLVGHPNAEAILNVLRFAR